jgi:hypothetical protein
MQQAWEQWFQKLSEMLVHYDMSTGTIIHAVTGHLHADSVFMYGWTHAVDSSRQQQKPITLEAFFMHICNQLFIALNTRHKAYEELFKLKLSLFTSSLFSLLLNGSQCRDMKHAYKFT